MKTLAASEARKHFSETLTRVGFERERIVLERNGRGIAALVPVEDLQLLERLEDAADVQAAGKALKGGKFKTLTAFRKERNLR